jgi:hypothetical protein
MYGRMLFAFVILSKQVTRASGGTALASGRPTIRTASSLLLQREGHLGERHNPPRILVRNQRLAPSHVFRLSTALPHVT